VTSDRRPRGSLIAVALVGLVGLVWIAQGLGVPIGGGFMVGDGRWSAIGLGLVAIAAFLAWRRLRVSH